MNLIPAFAATLVAASGLAVMNHSGQPIPEEQIPGAGLDIDHVLIVTDDFDSLTNWYIDVLGFRFEDRWTAPDVVPGLELSYLVHPGGARLEIVGGADVKRPDLPAAELTGDFAFGGFRHVCFAVENIDAVLQSAEAKGATVLAQPFDYPRLKRRLAFVQDPDGNVVEFTSPMRGQDSEVSPVSDSESVIRSKLERWRDLWSQTGREQRYTLTGYEDLFDTRDENLLVFDSYVPTWATTQIVGFDDYRTIWEHDVNASFPGWTIVRMDIVKIEVAESGDLAWSALNFWGEGNRPDGTTYEGSQHGTHVWRMIDGDWKIVHEHLTAPITVHGQPNKTIDGSHDTTPEEPR